MHRLLSQILIISMSMLTYLPAQVPKIISYQGVLTDNAGTIVADGTYSFVLSLYDVQSGGTVLWTETKSITVANGLFTTALGDQTAFPASLLFDQPYWLDIQVDGEQLIGRVALQSVPYSLQAAQAEIARSIDPDANLVVGRIYIYQEGSTPGSVFKIDNATNNSIVMDVETFGTGQVGRFRQSNSSSNVHAVSIINEGLGRALDVKAYGTADGSSFEIHNSSNVNNAIYAETDGSGNAIKARTTGSGYAGYFDGDIYTTGSYLPSDIRWKRDISQIENALQMVKSLRGVQYLWNREKYPERGFKTGKQYGLIAQEVEEIQPELVREDQDGYKAVDYQKITAFLVEAVKEQQKQIEELKVTVVTLQAQSDMASTD